MAATLDRETGMIGKCRTGPGRDRGQLGERAGDIEPRQSVSGRGDPIAIREHRFGQLFKMRGFRSQSMGASLGYALRFFMQVWRV